MLSTTKLKELGLNPSEITVYLYLLEHGESDPNHIAKDTGVLRTNCYNILKQLQIRELIEKHADKRPVTYSPNSPTALLQDIEYKKDIVDLLLPELNNLYSSSKDKPSIKIYEGADEVKTIFYELINNGEVLGLTATDKLHMLFPDFLAGEWVDLFKKHSYTLRDIVTKEDDNQASKNMKAVLGDQYEYKVLPAEFGDIWTDLLIWEDNVALINLTDPVFGTVIRNKQIADMMRMMFEYMWRTVK